MRSFHLAVDRPGSVTHPREQLGWRIAEFAGTGRPVEREVAALIGARVLDALGAMQAAHLRPSVANARAQALAHCRDNGAAIVGAGPRRAACEWAALANGIALRELDLGDMYVGADYARPGDSIPALLAVAQQCRKPGTDLVCAIATACEVHVALARSIVLHRHGIDPVVHLAPAVAAGLGTLLHAPPDVVVHAVHAAAQLACMSRIGRADGASTWRSYAPAAVAKLAIECMDRALRGETAPDAVYEAPQGLVDTFLGGPGAGYTISLPEPGEPCRGILETFPKAHQVQNQCQALIDLALRMRQRIASVREVEQVEIATSRHLHRAIGSSWRDDPAGEAAPRPARRLDALRILAHVLRHGGVPPDETGAPDPLEQRIRTTESAEWSVRSHDPDPKVQCFGAQMRVVLAGGGTLVARMEWPDAHPLGERPWQPEDYVQRFRQLTAGCLTAAAQDALAERTLRLEALSVAEVNVLDFPAPAVDDAAPARDAIF